MQSKDKMRIVFSNKKDNFFFQWEADVMLLYS